MGKRFWRVETDLGMGPYGTDAIYAAQQANIDAGEGCSDFYNHPAPGDSREAGTDLYALAFRGEIEGVYRFGFATKKQALEWWAGKAARRVLAKAGFRLTCYEVTDRVDGRFQSVARIGSWEGATIRAVYSLETLKETWGE